MEKQKQKKKKIIFVCSGNTCRSPMMEALFKQELKKRKIKDFTIASAGIRVKKGDTIHSYTKRVLDEINCPYSEKFKSKRLTKNAIESAWLIVAMTDRIADEIECEYVYSMKELTGFEIQDPYGKEIEEYQYCLHVCRRAVPKLIEKILSSI